jgi:transposase-like protein
MARTKARARARAVSFRLDLTEQEKAQLAELAREHGIPQGVWMRLHIREAHAALERDRKRRETLQ